MWSSWQGPGLGHLRLAVRARAAWSPTAWSWAWLRGAPFRLSYEVRCDHYWRVRAARVGVPGEPPRVELLSDGEGNWTGPDGRAVAYLQGCEYVDISETPFTNSLPIRRLGLAPEGSAEIAVAYFDGAELQPWPEPQRYTRLETGDGGGLYRFLSLDGGFSADLPVDLDGLVLDYPELFREEIPLAATSENPLKAKFAEFHFYELRWGNENSSLGRRWRGLLQTSPPEPVDLIL